MIRDGDISVALAVTILAPVNDAFLGNALIRDYGEFLSIIFVSRGAIMLWRGHPAPAGSYSRPLPQHTD